MPIETRAPNSDYATTGSWTGAGGSRYLLIDDFPDTTDGIAGSDGGTILFGFDLFDIPAGSTIHSVKVRAYTYLSAAGSSLGNLVLVTNSVSEYFGAWFAPSTSPSLQEDTWTDNPITFAPWTVDEVNGIGIEGLTHIGLSMIFGGPDLHITSMQVDVDYDLPPGWLQGSASGSSTVSGSLTLPGAIVGSTLGSASVLGTMSLIQVRPPTSDITRTGTWTGSAGSRYTAVDDFPDTSTGLTVGTVYGVLTFGFAPFSIPDESTINSVQVDYYARSTGSSANNMASRIVVGGSSYDSAYIDPPTGITLYTKTWETNPKTGIEWTVDDVNNVSANKITQFGFSSLDANPTIFVSSIQLSVSYTPPTTEAYGPLIGSTSGTATVSGSIAAPIAIEGSAAGTATVLGFVGAIGALSATTTASASTSGTLGFTASLEGSSSGSATAVGTMVGSAPMAGSSSGIAAANGTLAGTTSIAGLTSGLATGGGTLTGLAALAGSASSSASVTGSIAASTTIAGTTSGSATVTGTLAGTASMTGSSIGTAAVSGILGDGMRGSTAGSAAVAGSLVASGSLSGTAAGTAESDCVLAGIGSLLGNCDAITLTASSLHAWGRLAGNSDGITLASSSLAASGMLAGSTSGSTTVSGRMRTGGSSLVSQYYYYLAG